MESDAVLAPLKALSLPDTRAAAESARKAESRALACRIADVEEYALVADDLKAVKTRWDRLEEQRTAITGPMNVALKAVNALFKAPMDYLKNAEAGYKNAMLGFQSEQRRIEAKAQAEADRLAREARAKLEADAKVLRDAIAAEQAAMAQNAPNQLADELSQKRIADLEVAVEAKVMEAEVTIAAPMAAPVRVAGISMVKTPDFEVMNLGQMLVWIVSNMESNPAVLAYALPNEKAIRAQVRATGLATVIGGVRIFEKDTIRA